MHWTSTLTHRVWTALCIYAKKSFYCAANAVFSKIGHIASEKVTLSLIKSKCLPVLLYGLEACPLTKSDLQSLDFVIIRFFMKLFITKSIETIKYCHSKVLWLLFAECIMGQARSYIWNELQVFFCPCYNCLISFVLLIVCCLPCLPGE